MKTAKEGGKNKQRQAHTNTLETNTIRIKSWVSRNSRAPAITAIVAGFLLLGSNVPALVQNSISDQHLAELAAAHAPDPGVTTKKAPVASTDADYDENEEIPADRQESDAAETKSSAGASIRIEMSVESSGKNSQPEAPQPTAPAVTVNGHEVELPRTGRINEKLKTDEGTTRIRGRINADGGSSINITTDSTFESEVH